MSKELDFIRNNQYLNSLKSLAHKHALNGSYIELQSLTSKDKSENYFVCGLNANTALANVKNPETLLFQQNQSTIQDYGIHLFRLDGCDPQKTYLAVEEFCEEAELIKPIYGNKFLNSLDSAVEKFGMTGTYVFNEIGTNSDYSGIYFVCGTDRDEILNGEIDIKNTILSQGRNGDNFYYKIKVFPLDDFYSFVTHQNVINFCRDSLFVRELFEKYKSPIPDYITNASLDSFKLLNSTLKDPKLNAGERKIYEKALNDAIALECSFHNPSSRYYKTTRQDKPNKQGFGFGNKGVSLERIFLNSGMIGHIGADVKYTEQIKKELDKRPEILYWMSRPMEDIVGFPSDDKLFRIGKDNKLCRVHVAYDMAYKEDVVNIINRICFPEAYKTNKEMFYKNGFTPYLITIPEFEYDNFVSLCKANGVSFYMDEELRVSKNGELNVIIPKEKAKTVDGIFSRLALESENFKITFERPAVTNKFTNLSSLNRSKNKSDITNELAKTALKQFPGYEIVGGSFDDFDK